MGIPKFYRWLSERYPLISQYLDETHEFDNFYLDMNGIIHQCTHPNEGELVATDLPAMFNRIFAYTDRLYRIVRPRKLLFLAVDGVAPRAKVNQQRSRRFRAAKDNEKLVMENLARRELERRRRRGVAGAGGDDSDDWTDLDDTDEDTQDSEEDQGTPTPSDYFDSNCITPGTQFMAELSAAFKVWIDEKKRTDVVWQQGCNVVFSGCEVPGEGEHKIMDCIREWRNSPMWEPTVRHCMYGLDADLIMLGLVTHEPHFTLLRERLRRGGGRRRNPISDDKLGDAQDFELLEIALLRDMLYVEFTPQHARLNMATARFEESKSEKGPLPFKYESHRVVDDFVFMCMLVGNDFVPHIAHLDIAEGALNIMFRCYKELLGTWGGYLTDAHRLHPDRLESFLKKISERTEAAYFRNKSREEEDPGYNAHGYKRRYYMKKLGLDIEQGPGVLEDLKQKYLEGLHWVLQYYHNGCQSWSWYYPYLYAPLASDMRNLRSYKIRFQRGRPFRPLTQLLAVLPPDSAQFLPEPYRELMVSPTSPVIDFYPTEFEVDLNGKKNAWEAVVLIPFIDEGRLLNEIKRIDPAHQLTKDERARDRLGRDTLFLSKDFPFSRDHIPPIRPRGVFSGANRRSRFSGAGATTRDSRGAESSASRSNGRASGSGSGSAAGSPAKRRGRRPGSTAKEKNEKDGGEVAASAKPRRRRWRKKSAEGTEGEASGSESSGAPSSAE